MSHYSLTVRGHPPPRRGSRHHCSRRRRHCSPASPRRLRRREDRRMDRSRTHQGRPPRTEPRPPPHHQEHQAPAQDHGGVRAADTADDVAGAARACSGSQLPAPLLIAPMVKLHSPSPPTSPPSRRSSSCSSALRGCDSPTRRAASRAANKSGATSCAPAAAPRCHHTCGDQLPFLHTVLAARSPLREQCGSGVQRQTPSRFTPLPRQAFPCLLRPGVCFQAVWHQRAAAL